ncbi:MotB family protein [Salinarimonas chemoclinalis]|uniref:MotB family protein n=1 Tax=Salinarimonas chemoclinalis TaxID=3241599 RepID=UPI003557844C
MQENQGHELVIIRRRPDPEADEPKGGVWKIAYADFMTAMMAFFLVMWLINATDQETREVVATYFNPIRLAEATSDRKGLRDPDASSQGVDLEERSDAPVTEADAEHVEARHTPQPVARRYSETALFQDPYAVLAELSAQAAFAPATPAAGIDPTPGERGEPGLVGGDAFRDPFDPVYWQLAPQPAVGRADGDGTGGPMGLPDAAAPLGLGGPAGSDARALAAPTLDVPTLDVEARAVAGAAAVPAAVVAIDEPPAQEAAIAVAAVDEADAGGAPQPAPVRIAATGDDAPAGAPSPEAPSPEAPSTEEPSTEEPTAEAPSTEAPSTEEEALDPALVRAAALRARISAAMAQATGAAAPENVPAIEVSATPEGLLVSLTDDADFGMFAIGSAEPRPELVRVVEEIAPILAAEAGAIVIRGHTDARPFRSETYDNWRLSSARAHMAYYMLVRGGFAEERILRVEGHADRMLKVADDPYADENRRIEILLREARS